jgi:hypothetical protein
VRKKLLKEKLSVTNKQRDLLYHFYDILAKFCDIVNVCHEDPKIRAYVLYENLIFFYLFVANFAIENKIPTKADIDEEFLNKFDNEWNVVIAKQTPEIEKRIDKLFKETSNDSIYG